MIWQFWRRPNRAIYSGEIAEWYSAQRKVAGAEELHKFKEFLPACSQRASYYSGEAMGANRVSVVTCSPATSLQ